MQRSIQVGLCRIWCRSFGTSASVFISKSKSISESEPQSKLRSKPKSKTKTKTKAAKSLESWDRGGRQGRNAQGSPASSSFTPVFDSVKRLMDSNQGCVTLVQIGSFYELHFDQAETYAPKLGLKVAYKRTADFTIPMAGFPVAHIKKYTEMLIQDHGVSVAIVDQCHSQSRTMENLIHRKVSRIVSPGTLIDESFMNYGRNNYLTAIYFPPNMTKFPANPDMSVGLSWIDISTGESFVQGTTLSNLAADLSRISPSEILISKEYSLTNQELAEWYPPLQILNRFFIRYHKTIHGDHKLQFKGNFQTVRKVLESLSKECAAALNLASSYISVNLPDVTMLLDLPSTFQSRNSLQMDARTREALELTERSTSGRSSSTGTLLSSIRRTRTTSGSRLLCQWLEAPSTSVSEIEYRQNFVKCFSQNKQLTLSTRQQLQKSTDIVRFLQKILVGSADDIYNLKMVAVALTDLQSFRSTLLDEYGKDPEGLAVFKGLLGEFAVPEQVACTISSAIIDDSPAILDSNEEVEGSQLEAEENEELNDADYSNTFIDKYRTKEEQDKAPSFRIRSDYLPKLKELYDELRELEEKENNIKTSILADLLIEDPKATVTKREQWGRWSNILLINAKPAATDSVAELQADNVVYKKAKVLACRPKEWVNLQHEIMDIQGSIKACENNIIAQLKAAVADKSSEIRALAKVVDFLDVTSSFAVLAEEHGWVCPKIVRTPTLDITQGRHVVVDSGLKAAGQMFVPNSAKLNKNSKMWVISGPNMGGKSTFLRQNALMVILAQIGSFVPAEKATIGIVDKIFTRIGASDDLYNDLSTFMVEMIETSTILLNATNKSLAIVDEVGRGTSGKEGLAIAYATLISLLQICECRTFFATHFAKELKQLLDQKGVNQDKLSFYKTRVLNTEKDSGPLIIDRTLREGISERSHALEVARQAGFPEFALKEAEAVLEST
ncbi:uncharacterized protein LODBEIA_P15640 [Lodderomyces beijingensis]|uniref:DNA mismatch repair proteins mutS family domain-containing protein n=1 Tax=Lodderomyces beijingensis TaxID=1775926 RepID=A0ABP0ZJG7_9ASCO